MAQRQILVETVHRAVNDYLGVFVQRMHVETKLLLLRPTKDEIRIEKNQNEFIVLVNVRNRIFIAENYLSVEEVAKMILVENTPIKPKLTYDEWMQSRL